MAKKAGLRRDNGDGTIIRKNYKGKTYLYGQIMIDGTLYPVKGKTEKEIKTEFARLKINKPKKRTDQYSVKEWLEKWLEEQIKPFRKEQTYLNYESISRIHLIPSIGKINLTDLRTSDIQKVLDTTRYYYTKSGTKKEYSKDTLRLIRTVLAAALKSAEKDDLITKNFASLTSSSYTATTKTHNWITLEDMKRILEVDTSTDSKETALQFLLVTGLRRGELLGLKWSDVDFKEKTLTINRNLIRGKSIEKGISHLYTDKPKTASSIRTIPLMDIAFKILKDHQLMQNKKKKELGTTYKDQKIIFSNDNGDFQYPDSLQKAQNRLFKKAGLEKIRIHDLRHSFASSLFDKDIDQKSIQMLLGHSNLSTTMNIYVKVTDEKKKEAIQKMNSLMIEDDEKQKSR